MVEGIMLAMLVSFLNIVGVKQFPGVPVPKYTPFFWSKPALFVPNYIV